MVKNLPARQETRFDPWVRQIPYAVGSIGKKKKKNKKKLPQQKIARRKTSLSLVSFLL